MELYDPNYGVVVAAVAAAAVATSALREVHHSCQDQVTLGTAYGRSELILCNGVVPQSTELRTGTE